MAIDLGGLIQSVFDVVRGKDRFISPAPREDLNIERIYGQLPYNPGAVVKQASQPKPIPKFFPGGRLPNRPDRAAVPATPENFQDLIASASAQTDTVSPLLLSTLIGTESSFRPDVYGSAVDIGHGPERAAGLGQFLPSTVADLVKRGILQPFDPLIPAEAVPAVALYLDYLIDQSGGSLLGGLTRYKGSGKRAQEVIDLMSLVGG